MTEIIGHAGIENTLGFGIAVMSIAATIIVALITYGPGKKTVGEAGPAGPIGLTGEQGINGKNGESGIKYCTEHIGMVREITANGVLLGVISNRLDSMEEKQDKAAELISGIHQKLVEHNRKTAT